MKISTKGRYALRMLLDLAQQPQDQYIPLKDISARQNISKKYLEQIIPLLHKKEILDSVRGNAGGYKLKKQPSEISLYDILSQTENESRLIHCLDMEDCENDDQCLARGIWQDLDTLVNNFLKETNLQDVLDRNE